MKSTKLTGAVAFLAASTMLLGACGSSNAANGGGNETIPAFDPNAKTTITFGAWAVSQSPEFGYLKDGFMKKYPNVTVEIKEYSNDNYEKQLTADLAAGKPTDVIPLKSMNSYYTFAVESKGLADLTDIAKSFDSKNLDSSTHELDGKYYGIPYRRDFWVMYYNKDIFEKTGIAAPDGTWTWDDYVETAEKMKDALKKAGYGDDVYPTFTWNKKSFVQDFANNQSQKDPKASMLSGDYNYFKPYYERALKLQDEKLALDFNTLTSTKATYQGLFGSQKIAFFPVGNWYTSALVSAQKKGDSEKFDWGIAPVPQNPDKSTNTQTDKPVTVAGAMGLAVSKYATGQKGAAAREFVKWAAGEEGALELAKNGVSPAYLSDKVTEAYLAADGMPTDELSKKTITDFDTKVSAPVVTGKEISKITTLLNDAHSAIMTETTPIDQALADAGQKAKDAGVVK